MKKKTDWKKKYYNLRKKYLKLKLDRDDKALLAYRYLEAAELFGKR